MHEQVLAALGGSIAYDECKGDYARARQISEAWLTEARQASDAGALADAVIWRAVVHLLQGEPQKASVCLGEAEPLGLDANLSLLVTSYKYMARLERFDACLDGGGLSSFEITARWNRIRESWESHEAWQYWRARATSREAISRASLALKLVCFLKTAREQLGSASFAPFLQGFASPCIEQRTGAEANGEHGIAAYATWCAADLYRRGGNLAEAGTLLNDARLLYEKADDPVGVALCHMTDGDWRCAPTTTPLAWNFAWREDVTYATITSSFQTTPHWPDARAVAEARAYYTKAECMFREAGAPRGVAAVHLRSGYLAWLNQDLPAAVRCAQEAHAEFMTCGDERGRATAYAHLIMGRLFAGQLTGLAELATTIGEWGQQHGNFGFCLSLGFLLSNVGRHWLNDKGDLERALAAFSAAEMLHQALGAATTAAQAVANQGFVYDAVGERPTALTHFERALDLYARAMRSLPAVTNEVLAQVAALGHSVFNLYLGQTDGAGMQRTVERLKKALAVARETASALPVTANSDMLKQFALASLAESAQQCGEITSVLSPVYQARKARDLGDDKEASRLLAQAEIALPKVGASQRFLLEMALLAEQALLGEQKKFEQAAAAFRKHLEQQQHRDEHDVALTTFVRVKAYADAKTHFDALSRMSGENWWASSSRPWVGLTDCGEMYEGLGDLAPASAYYERAIVELEARRSRLSRNELKTALAADKGSQYLYFQAARASFKRGDHERAFSYAERGKARGLLDLIAGGIALRHLPNGGTAALRSWRQLNAQLTLWRGLLAGEHGQDRPNAVRIAELTARIEADEAALSGIEAELAESHPGLRQVIASEATTLSLDQVAAALEPNTLLLEYLFLSENVLGWAIGPEGVVQAVILSIDTRALSRDIRAVHRACAGRVSTEALSAELAKTLLQPFAEAIQASSHLLIVPYGAAHGLPFHALPFDGKPLGDSHTISYLPNASTLQFLRSTNGAPRVDRVLAVGNPTGNLPAAAIEAAYVARLFGEEALIGKAATEETVRERIMDAPLLHFATHGNLSETAPLSSSIALANGEELTVYELIGMQLKADLVVLSACNTGQGEITGGDDVLGLTRGLLAAGARAAIVSLWPVDDLSTSLLMAEFYRGLQAGELPSAALVRAQRHLRSLTPAQIKIEQARLKDIVGTKAVQQERLSRFSRPSGRVGMATDYTHPYFWAPFMFVGAA